MPPQTPTSNPVMDVVAPPPPDKPVAPPSEPVAAPEADKQKPQKVVTKEPTRPKQPGNGVGMAIFATVVIVLVLAALATYAYLQTAT